MKNQSNILEKTLEFHKPHIGIRLTTLNLKEMLQRFSIFPAQIKASDASENLSSEIRQIEYSLI